MLNNKYLSLLFLLILTITFSQVTDAYLPKLVPGKTVITTNVNTGSSSFLGLSDTPDSYSSANGMGLFVNETSGQIYFAAVAGSGTVTSITRGYGFNLTGTSITATGTLDINTSVLQSRVTGTCSAGSSIRVINQDGTVTCETDDSGASTNIFDQILNTTSNVTFESVNATREIYVGNIAVKQWLYNQSDGVGTGNASWNQSFANTLYASIIYGYNQTIPAQTHANNNFNYSSFILNLTSIDCPGGQLVIGVQANGTVLCAADSQGTANSSFNQTLTDSLYASIIWNYNQTTPAITDINARFWNRTQSYNITQIDAFNSSWTTTYNATYNNLLGQMCPVGTVVNGTLSNGTLVCTTDQTGAGSSLFTVVNDQITNITTVGLNITNLTLTDKITFRLQETIDNLVDGLITITGNLKATDINATGDLYVGDDIFVADRIEFINTTSWRIDPTPTDLHFAYVADEYMLFDKSSDRIDFLKPTRFEDPSLFFSNINITNSANLTIQNSSGTGSIFYENGTCTVWRRASGTEIALCD